MSTFDVIISSLCHTCTKFFFLLYFKDGRTTQSCPPDLALSAIEMALSDHQKRLFRRRYDKGYDIAGADPLYQTWIKLKIQVSNMSNVLTFHSF